MRKKKRSSRSRNAADQCGKNDRIRKITTR